MADIGPLLGGNCARLILAQNGSTLGAIKPSLAKAAYHQQCIECHRNEAKGPVDCVGCHPKNVPDHKELVKLPADPEPRDVTPERNGAVS